MPRIRGTIAHLKTLCAYPNRPDIQLAERWKAAYPARRAMPMNWARRILKSWMSNRFLTNCIERYIL